MTHDEAPLAGHYCSEDLRQVLGEARFHDERCTADIACSQAVGTVRAAIQAGLDRDAVRTMSRPTRDRVRKCAAENCYLLYLDTSRPGRRRWCSMQRCGNRHKVSEHRQRHGGTR